VIVARTVMISTISRLVFLTARCRGTSKAGRGSAARFPVAGLAERV
jgi:hypothetical protein